MPGHNRRGQWNGRRHHLARASRGLLYCGNMTETSLQALGICLEEYEYPYPVRFLPVSNDLQSLTMAYMDIPRATRVVVPECGHIPHLEAPSTFLGQLLPFLAN